VKYRDLVRRLEKDGWFIARHGRGSHVVYRHAQKPGIVVIAAHNLGREVPIGTLVEILRQAGLI
jgi:predicted RNA binding protein YcfA (HicA-like mRNA interferase family)